MRHRPSHVVRVHVPLPRALYRHSYTATVLWRAVPLGLNKDYSGVDGSGKGRRVRRAAASDIWRSCQLGGDCPTDVYQKFTHTTIADRILQWGGAATFLGGLNIGTGTSGVRDATVPWASTSDTGAFIPRERPFQLPTADIPVTVEDVGGIAINESDTGGNTFVNPVFDGDLISVNSSDNVVISEIGPAGGSSPVDWGVTDRTPTTRGDTFVPYTDVVEDVAVPDTSFGTGPPTDPYITRPFETLEMRDMSVYMPRGSTDVADTSFIDVQLPSSSTPVRTAGRGRPVRIGGGGGGVTIAFENPVYEGDESRLIDAGWVDVVEPGATVVPGRRGGLILTRIGMRAGAVLRSGYQLFSRYHILGEISPVGIPGEPAGVELRSIAPTGSSTVYVGPGEVSETVLSEASTVPWYGLSTSRAAADDTNLSAVQVAAARGFDEAFDVYDGMDDIPLDDPFPEMEIVDDAADDDVGPGGRVATVSGHGSHMALTVHIDRLGVGRGVPTRVVDTQGGSDVPAIPSPAVVVDYDYGTGDPFWLWFHIKRRRRRRRVFFR